MLIRHYDKTLDSWLKRFLKNKHIAKDLFDKKFVKMWEFYLASCSAAFKYRDLVVFQYQLVKNFDAIPSNRRDYIYSWWVSAINKIADEKKEKNKKKA